MGDDFPYPDDRGQTHSPGCWKWRGHHNCAVARVRELEARLAEAEATLHLFIEWAGGLRYYDHSGEEDFDDLVSRSRAFLEGKE